MNLINLQVLVALFELVAGFFAPMLPGHYIKETARISSAISGIKTLSDSVEGFAGRDEHAFPDPTPEEIMNYFSTDTPPLPTLDSSPTNTESSPISTPTSSSDAVETTNQSGPVTSTGSTTSESSSTSSTPSETITSTTPVSSPTQSSPASTPVTSSPSTSSSPVETTPTTSTPISTTPLPTPTQATPTFTTHYETFNGNPANPYEVFIEVKVTPTDLAGTTINGIQIDLSGQGFSTPYEGNSNVNSTGYGSTTDWKCQLGTTSTCQGTTAMKKSSKSIFVFFFNTSVANAPSNLQVTILSDSQTVTTLKVPLQNP